MLSVRFTIAGEQQYARAFDVMARELGDLRDPLQRVRDRLVQTVGEQFRSEGSHGSSGWAPLSPTYEAWKESAYPGRPILVRTGDMRAAFLVDGTRELTATKLRWGVDDQRDADGNLIAERAHAHQAGSGLPERRIVALTHDDKRAIDRVFVEHIQHVRRNAFGASR